MDTIAASSDCSNALHKNGKKSSSSTKAALRSAANKIRAFFLVSAIFILVALCSHPRNGRNWCLWCTTYAPNALAAIAIALKPKLLDHVVWISWSIVASSLHLFLLLVLTIHLVRAIMAERESIRIFAEEDDSLLAPTLNIMRYEEGKETTSAFIILLWLKMVNKFKSYIALSLRQEKPVDMPRPKTMFSYCGSYSLIICAFGLVCTSFCGDYSCLYLIGW